MSLIELWEPKVYPVPATARKIVRWNEGGELKASSTTLAEAAASKQRRIDELTIAGIKVTQKRMDCLKAIVKALEGIPEEHAVLASHLTSQMPFKRWVRTKIMADLQLLVKAGWIKAKADKNRGWWKYWAVDKAK